MATSSILRLHSDRVAVVDLLRREDASVLTQSMGIAAFMLLTVLGAQVRLYLWEVPFTLQTLAVYGSGLYLGWRNGMIAQLLYISLGLLLPVYAGDGFGPAYLFGAVSAGYLFGFPLAAAVSGKVSKQWNGMTGSVLSLAVASLVLFGVGVTWLHYAAGHTSWLESIDKGWVRFVVVDLAKILFVSLVYTGSRMARRA